MSLILDQIRITHNNIDLFRQVTLKIENGRTAAVMGPSGCGKSTLLSAVCGSLPGDFKLHGDIILNGVSILNIPMEKRRVGILFQDDLLFPHMSTGSNLGFAIPGHVPEKERRDKIENALEIAGLKGFYRRDTATLSGGQRARVSLLRALLAEPEALLLDEPFAKFDNTLKIRIRKFVYKQIRRMNIPALLVTHDPGDISTGPVINL